MVGNKTPWTSAKRQIEKHTSFLMPSTPPRAAGAVTVTSVGNLLLDVLESIDLVDEDSVNNGNSKRSTGRRPKFGFLTSSSTTSCIQPTVMHAVSIAAVLVHGLDDSSDSGRLPFHVNSGAKVVRTSTKLVHVEDKVIQWSETFSLRKISGGMKLHVYATDYFPGYNEMKIVGRAIVPLTRFPLSESIEQWYQLHPLVSSSNNTITKAAVRLRLKFDPMASTLLPKHTLEFRSCSGSFEEEAAGSVNSTNTHRTFSSSYKRSSLVQGGLESFGLDVVNEFGSNNSFFLKTSASALVSDEDYASFAKKLLRTGIVDYFLICGPLTDDNGNLRLVSNSEHYTCTDSGIERFQSAMNHLTGTSGNVEQNNATALESLELESDLLESFPTEPREDVSYSAKDDWFCFPDGLYLKASDERPPPTLSSFIRCCDGVKSYGLALTVYFQAKISLHALLDLLLETEKEGGKGLLHTIDLQQWSQTHAESYGALALWVPVCVCLVSRVPVIHSLMEWLGGFQSCLESIERKVMSPSRSPGGTSLVDNHLLQAAIFQLVMEVPLPIPGVWATSVKAFQENDQPSNPKENTYRFALRDVRDIPYCGYGLSTLARCLGPDGVVTLFSASVQECRILLHSRCLALLPYIAEGMCTLMYPLQWPYAYVPVLPKMLLEHVESPQPFVLGVHSRWLKHLPCDVFNELVVVDCDTGTVHAPHISPCPRSIRRRLIKAVREVTLLDLDFKETWKDFSTPLCKRRVPSSSTKKAIEMAERRMQYAFVKAMADLLYGFTDCLFFVEQDRPIFNSARFLNEYAKEDHIPFISCVIDTLAFAFLMENYDVPDLYPFMKLMSSLMKEAFKRGEFTHRHRSSVDIEDYWDSDTLQISDDSSIPTIALPNILLDKNSTFMLDTHPIEDVPEHDDTQNEKKGSHKTQVDDEFSVSNGSSKYSPSPDSSIKGSNVSSREENDLDEPGDVGSPPPCDGEEEGTELLASGVQDELSVNHTANEGNSGHPSQVSPSSQLEEGWGETMLESESAEPSSEVMSSSPNGTAEEAMAATTSKLHSYQINDEESSCGSTLQLQNTGGNSSSPTSSCVVQRTSFSLQSTTLEGEDCCSMKLPIAPPDLSAPAEPPPILLTSESEPLYFPGVGTGVGRSSLLVCIDSTLSSRLRDLLTMGVSSQAEQILELVQWEMDPVLHLQTELWPIPQSFSLFQVEKVIGKDLREELRHLIHSSHTDEGSLLGTGIGSPSQPKASFGFDTGTEGKQLQECLEAIFSGQHIPEKILQGAEESLREHPAVRSQFLEVLQQPRRGGMRSTGPFLLHELGFEALALFSYTLLRYCVDARDYNTAHMLLQLTGAYYQVHFSEGSSRHVTNDSNSKKAITEFLSARLCRHSIFWETEFWLHIAEKRVESESSKTWKARTASRYVSMSTHSLSIDEGGNYHESIVQESDIGPDNELKFQTAMNTNSSTRSNTLGSSHHFVEPSDSSDVIFMTNGQNLAPNHQYSRNGPELHMLKTTLYEMAAIGLPESACRSFIASAVEMHRTSSAGLSFLNEKANDIWGGSRAGQDHTFFNSPNRTLLQKRTATGGGTAKNGPEEGLMDVASRDYDSGSSASPVLHRRSHSLPFDPPEIDSIGSSVHRSLNPSFGNCRELIKGGTGQPHVTRLESVGRLVLAGRSDSSIAVWDLVNEDLLTLMNGHTDAITSITCCAGMAVTASLDNTLRVWKLPGDEGKQNHDLPRKEPESRKSHFSWWQPNSAQNSMMESTCIMSGHKGPVNSLVLLETEEMKRFENVTKLSIDQYVSRRESLHLPSVGHKGSFHVLSGSTDGDIRMWGLQDGNCYVIFSGHTGPITALSSMWSAKVVISGSEDCSVCLWDVNSESGHKALRNYVEHVASVTVAGFMNSSVSITGSADGVVNMWDKRCKAGILSFEGHAGSITSLSFGKEVVCTASSDSLVKVWDLRAMKKDPLRELKHHVDRVNCLLPLEKSVLSCSEDSVVFEWDIDGNTDYETDLNSPLGEYHGHKGGVSCMCYSADGFISGSWDGGVTMWPRSNIKG